MTRGPPRRAGWLGPSVEAAITELAPGGDGVAHVEVDGERRALFVPRTTPGDVARVAVDLSRRPARGRLVELRTRGPDRVDPACHAADRCGGCDWMHVATTAQARAHAGHVRAALPPAWRETPIAIHEATTSLRSRARARVHVRCERSGRASVGMHESGTHDPVEVDECVILEPPIEEARRLLPAFFAGARGSGDVDVALGAGGRPVVHARWRGDLPPVVFSRLEAAVASGAVAGAQVALSGAARPARIGDPTPWTTGGDGAPLRLSPGGFAQANGGANAQLARHVADAASSLARGEAVVELFSGAGNLSVLLARITGALVCVESDVAACAAARENLVARGLDAHVVERDAADYTWSKATRLVILDPPRTGARAVAERLAGPGRVSFVVYVSCDAQTLRRDLALLEPAYVPRSVATFEMFPHTSHVETVVALERRRR